MLHQEFDPPEALSDTIKCFWYDRSEHAAEGSCFEVVPDGYAEIIFHFGSGCSISCDDGLQPLPSPFMMGLLNQPAIFCTKNMFEVIGVRCFPWTVFDLLGLTPGKGGVRTFEHPVAALQPVLQPLMQAGKVEEALAEVTRYFTAIHSKIASDSLLFKAGAAMREAKGSIRVNRVAEAAHATVRTLERKFKQSSGHTVKDVAALMRFEQARNRLWLHPAASLAALAYELGYTDQSHLSREFRRYSGTTPAAFARKVKREKLPLKSDFVAFVQA